MTVPPIGRTRASIDYTAPDGSEIRLIVGDDQGANQASLCEVRLEPGLVSKPVRHNTVEEIWYVLEGEGEVWRSPVGANERPLAVTAGDALVIPTHWNFQFKASPRSALRFLCYDAPPWPREGTPEDVEHGALGEPILAIAATSGRTDRIDDQTRTFRYQQLDILDHKCGALLQLSSFVVAVNVLAPAIGRVGGVAVLASAFAVVAFLVTGLLALSVITVDWVPGENVVTGRTQRYRLAIASTAVGLTAMVVFVIVALVRV